MEQRLIDANALKAKKTYSHERHEYIVPVAEIDWMPTVDAVPVVRCRECIYAERARVNDKGFTICGASYMDITDNDFCSYGERRTDD